MTLEEKKKLRDGLLKLVPAYSIGFPQVAKDMDLEARKLTMEIEAEEKVYKKVVID